MFAQIFRSQQPLFFRCNCREDHRARRTFFGNAESTRQLQQNAAAGSVVGRAVVDIVARRIGTNAQVVVVRGKHHRLVFHFAARTWQDRQHVVRFEIPHLTHHARF